MKQSWATSFLKSLVSTAAGFAIAMIANATVLPLFGYSPSLAENVALTLIYTAISVARQYALERVFEALGWRARMSAFALAVLAERARQVSHEGWTSEHDDGHAAGELAKAGACYALWAGARAAGPPPYWPWQAGWWKPADTRRDLVKGCALMMAEGEKFDRARKPRGVLAGMRAPGATEQKP
ncbi:MAG TPA: hypothetical protein VIH40_05620 [Xanthobacteraceae bacterium]